MDLEYDNEGKLSSSGDQQFESSESISLPIAGVRPYQAATVGLPGAQSDSLGDGSGLAVRLMVLATLLSAIISIFSNNLLPICSFLLQKKYLAQSHLLLYKAQSSCVLALSLGISGKINGSFELLPHTLTPEMLGTGSNGYSIGGPYSHWTELGQTQRDDGSLAFRVACVGRSWRTNQPKLLCVEFNAEEVRVREGRILFSIAM